MTTINLCANPARHKPFIGTWILGPDHEETRVCLFCNPGVGAGEFARYSDELQEYWRALELSRACTSTQCFRAGQFEDMNGHCWCDIHADECSFMTIGAQLTPAFPALQYLTGHTILAGHDAWLKFATNSFAQPWSIAQALHYLVNLVEVNGDPAGDDMKPAVSYVEDPEPVPVPAGPAKAETLELEF